LEALCWSVDVRHSLHRSVGANEMQEPSWCAALFKYEEEKKKRERESKEGKALYLRNGARPAHLGVGMVAHWDEATPPSERRDDGDAKVRFSSLRLIATGSADGWGSGGCRRHWDLLKLIYIAHIAAESWERCTRWSHALYSSFAAHIDRVLEGLRTSAQCVCPGGFSNALDMPHISSQLAMHQKSLPRKRYRYLHAAQ
jgi:hypothetical protein